MKLIKWMIPLALLVLIFCIVSILRDNRAAPKNAPVKIVVPASQKATSQVTLYFGSEDGKFLMPETREITGCDGDQGSCVRSIVQELVKGPTTAGLVRLLPQETELQAFIEQNGVAVLSFNTELCTRHSGGSMPELLTVYSLADTLATNFSYMRRIRILVDGGEVETLKGHVDLRHPIAANFSWVKPEHGGTAAPGEEMPPTFIDEDVEKESPGDDMQPTFIDEDVEKKASDDAMMPTFIDEDVEKKTPANDMQPTFIDEDVKKETP